MIPIHPQFLVDEHQQRKAVLVSAAEWERIVEELDELDDLRAYDEAKAKPQEALPLDLAVRMLREDRPS
ncbi:MAG: hypothetical protein ACOYMV_12605 [Verrucomicrobiia bacterium]